MVVVVKLIFNLSEQRNNEEVQEALLTLIKTLNVFINEHISRLESIQSLAHSLTMKLLDDSFRLGDVTFIR